MATAMAAPEAAPLPTSMPLENKGLTNNKIEMTNIADSSEAPRNLGIESRAINANGGAVTVTAAPTTKTVEKEEVNFGIDSAYSVVKDILEQITLNDSPPINDEGEEPKKSPNSLTSATVSLSTAASTLNKHDSPDNSSSKRRYSRQQHVIPGGTVEAEESHSPVSSLGNASTLSSIPSLEEGKKDTAALWMEQYNKSQTRAEMKMGNVALATLCIRTLDSIDASHVLPVQEQVLLPASESSLPPPMATDIEKSNSMSSKSPNSKKKPQLSIVTDTSTLSQKVKSPEQKSSPWHKRWKRKSPKTKKAVSPPGAIANEWTSSLDDDFPPTPVRSNRKPKSPDFQEPDQDATPRSKGGGARDATPRGGVAGGSFDSAEAVYTRDELEDTVPAPHENKKPDESPERADVDVSWSLENEDEEQDEEEEGSPDSNGFAPATSGDMENITEETEDDIAEEQGMHGNPSRRLDYHPESHTRMPLKKSQPPPTQVMSPRRFQMFGSEYARFLSTSPLAPTVAASRAQGKRKSVMGMRSSVPREFRSSKGNTMRTGKRALNIEDASTAALTGAITDIVVTHGTQMPPKGYYRISQTGEGDQFTALRKTSSHNGVSGLIPGRRTTQVFINVKKEPNWDRAAQRPCVTALAVIFPDRKEFVPPGFCVVRRYKSQPTDSNETSEKPSSAASMAADLNFGSTGERVFLCYRRSREGNPITGIFPLQPLNHETIPEGYTVMERTPRNHVADINTNAGAPVFLAFRQRLASLEPLRPLPLVLSVHSANPFDNLEDSSVGHGSLSRRMRGSSRKKRLSAYYCTGGTIVASEVGRFHIMDRTTHSLLSPSSITHRLSLIAASRRPSQNDMQISRVPTYASSIVSDVSDLGMEDSGNEKKEATRSSVNATDLTLDETASSGGSILTPSNSCSNLSQSLSNLSMGSIHDDGDDHSFTSNTSSIAYSSSAANVINQTLFSNNDAELQRCLEALDFIPTIETATKANCLEDDPFMRKLQARVAALTPILTSCYTHHGGSALIAVEGLTKLLTTTDFFSPDVASLTDPDSGASTRLTLLDLATQAVCDVATCTSRETSFGACVDFVQHAVEYSQGQLSARTIGCVLRFYLFVFYFGASVPTSSKGSNPVWTAGVREKQESSSERSLVALNDLPLLYEEPLCPASKTRRYLPGGAPQASALALKGLITSLILRLRKMSAGEAKAFADGVAEVASSEPFCAAVEGIVTSLVDNAVYRVDLANYTQLALHQVHRSGGSELFWFDMLNSCGSGLFGMAGKLPAEMKAGYILSFAVLANLVKVASGRIRHVPQTNEVVPRDMASKLLSLELVQHFIEQWERDQARLGLEASSTPESVVRSVETMAFSIRRLVVPCLLINTGFALEDGRVYRRVMQIVSELWCSPYYRRHMKMEIGVLVDQFALRILRLGPQIFAPGLMGALENKNSNESVSIGSLAAPNETKTELKTPLLSQQIDLLFEIKRWFDSDMAAVEFFLNYDTNLWSHEVAMGQMLPGTQWRLCQQLCGAICTIAEQSGELLSQQIRASRISHTIPPPSPTAATASAFFTSESPLDGSPEQADKIMREGSRHLQRASFEAVSQVLKSLAHSAATAMGVQYQELVSGWEENEAEESAADTDFSLSVATEPSTTVNTMSSPSPRSSKGRNVRTPMREDVQKQQKQPEEKIVGYWQSAIAAERRRAAASPYRSAVKHAAVSSNTNVGGSQKYKGLSPLKFDEAASSTLPDADVHLPVAFEIARTKNLKKAVDYLIACDFLTPSPRDVAAFLRLHRSQLDPAALGVFLAEGGTGGGEIEYWNQIRFNYFRPISFVGMNVEQGLRHFLTNCGFRLPGEAQQIDRVMTTFSQVYWEDNAGDLQKCPFHDRDTVFLIAFAIIMLNTDLHKSTSSSNNRKQRKRMTKSEFLNNLRGVDNNENISREYLSDVYDSIEANPISLHMTDGMSAHGSLSSSFHDESSEQLSLNLALSEALQNAKMSEELLRGVSVHEHPFYTVEDFGRHLGYESRHDALADVVRSVIATTWHHFHGLIHAVLDAAHLDPRGMEMSLDLLQYMLCTTICLDMTLERTAFMTQLARYKMFRERRGQRFSRDHQAYKSEGWYAKLEMNCADPSDDAAKLVALGDVRELVQDLRDSLRIDVTAKREMNCVVRRIRQGEFLLNDPTRFFIREGDLVKRGSRMGRTTKYRFFLFSDVLIYAKASTDDFKIHEELPLHLMKVTDWFPDKRQQMKTAFRIHHPRKTFIVFAESVEDRQDWVKDIRSAIEQEVERLTYLENARLAAAAVER